MRAVWRPGAAGDEAMVALAREALSCPAAAAGRLLSRLGFSQPEVAVQTLDRLAGVPQFLIPLPAPMLVELALAGNADQGLRHLDRYVSATGTRSGLYARLETEPAFAEGLAQLLCSSNFLADILVRDPEQLYPLFEDEGGLARAPGRSELRQTLHRQAGQGPLEAWLERLRRAHRRQLLRLGAAAVLARQSVIRTGHDLSALADAVLALVLERLRTDLEARHGRPRGAAGQPAQFVVIALGKLGGEELNYSSDIDLMFVYDEEGTTDGRLPVTNGEFFTRLGAGLVQALTATTAEGFLYRVDMRLRPEGSSGALVRSLRACWTYYETRGELWERQMLIKARTAAGSARLGARFRRLLVPFVYPASLDVRPQDEIARVKRRIEARVRQRGAGRLDLKLHPGGIRDIEFVAQCLQLLHGRADLRVRLGDTLRALQRLRRLGALRADEVTVLSRAYLFFRRLENLIQAIDGQQTCALPAEPALQCALARRCGLPDADALLARIDGHQQRVRRIYDSIFTAPAPAVAGWDWLLEAEPGAAAAATALERAGLVDGEAAHRQLLRLAGASILYSQSRQPLAELLPDLLASLAAAPDADGCLLRLARLVEAYGAPGSFLEMMAQRPAFRRLVMALCGASRFLCELMQRDPGLIEGLVAGPLQPAADEPPATGSVGPAALAAWRNHQLLRWGALDLLDLAAPEEVDAGLSELAATVLASVLDRTWGALVRRHGRPADGAGRPVGVVCLAAGKLGGRELDFGSDLDVFFVYGREGTARRGHQTNGQLVASLVQQTIRELQEQRLYQVDARLRPEGVSAPLAVSLAGYRRYLSTRASAWERLALSRARVVWGDADLGRQVHRAIERFVYLRPVDDALVDEMVGIRRRMEPRGETGRPPRTNVKRGAGGLVDIEFVAQLLQLQHGGRCRDLRCTGTRQALHRLMEHGLVPAAEGDALLAAYERLRSVSRAMRIDTDRGEEDLPDGRELDALARALGQPDGQTLRLELHELMVATRQHFTGFFARAAATGRGDDRGEQ